jgi:hypothetical protein
MSKTTLGRYLLCLCLAVLVAATACGPSPNADSTITATTASMDNRSSAETSVPTPVTEQTLPSSPATAQPPFPTPSATPTITSTTTNVVSTPFIETVAAEDVLYRLAYGTSYNLLEIGLLGEHAEPQHLHTPAQMSNSVGRTDPGPADALTAAFAHFSNRFAYWTQIETGKLWVSDLAYQDPQAVYTDDRDLHHMSGVESGEFKLVWTPDDLHVILDSQDAAYESLIYHLETGTVEQWPWKCDRVAQSPYTSRLATWCRSVSGDDRFAIIEWGGEILYSDSGPEAYLFISDQLETNSAWSADGEAVAYFDPADPDGHLFIVDSTGVQTRLFPGAAWWSTEDTLRSKIALPDRLIAWSDDGSALLVFAHELGTNSCPLWMNQSSQSPDHGYDIPCWQAVDVASGKPIWSIANSVDEDFSSYLQFYDAAVSPSGSLVALSAYGPGVFWTGVVDLGGGIIHWWDTGAPHMAWQHPEG